MRGGHNRKSTRTHVLQGSYRGDRHGQGGVKPEPVAPRCPRWLDKVARQEWRRCAPHLEKFGLLTDLDMIAFGLYCSVFSDWRAMNEQIDDEGSVVEGHRGVQRKHPLLGAANQAAMLLLTLAKEFGMTPASRQRLTLPEIDDDDDDTLDSLSNWKKRNLNNGNGSGN